MSFTVVSTAGAEGIEDRASHLPLSGRRLAEMADLGSSVIAIELLVAAQAVDVRGSTPLGRATGAAHALVRASIPEMAAGDPPPTDVEAIRRLISSGALG